MNEIHEGAAMWLFHFFIKKPAGAALSAWTRLASSRQPRQKGKLTSHCQVVHYVLNTYTTVNIIAEVDASINYK